MTTNKDLFAKHISLGTFIETGTCYGRSVEIALELGFERIMSVEGSEERYRHCVEKFKQHAGRVLLRHGHSAEQLASLARTVFYAPALFFLDAHPSGAGSFGEGIYQTNPQYEQSNILRAELTIIKERNVKGDVILIDDLTPDVDAFARGLFPHATFTLHSTDEGKDKVLEVVT